MVHPIRDAYYDHSPYHIRSAAFVHTKGLAANEKSSLAARIDSPMPAPPSVEPAETAHKKTLGPTIPLSMMRSRTPDLSSIARTRAPPMSAGESSHSTPPDIRTLTGIPIGRQQSNPPSQGNIKKKRMSLSELEQNQGPTVAFTEPDPPTPDTPVAPIRTGDPQKIAQFFPELHLSR